MIVFATVAGKCNLGKLVFAAAPSNQVRITPGYLRDHTGPTLRSRNDRRSLIRISALFRGGIYGRGNVVISLAGDDCVVVVRGCAIGGRVDHRVGTTRNSAA